MQLNFCPVCGARLSVRNHPEDGPVAFCERCGDWRYPLYSVAVSAAIFDAQRTHMLMIRQYGEEGLVFVAGYVDKGETAEDAVRREVCEELGMTAEGLRFHGSHWYAPSETLMLHYSCTVPEEEASPNREVEAWEWLPLSEVRNRVVPGGLAEQLLDDTFADS